MSDIIENISRMHAGVILPAQVPDAQLVTHSLAQCGWHVSKVVAEMVANARSPHFELVVVDATDADTIRAVRTGAAGDAIAIVAMTGSGSMPITSAVDDVIMTPVTAEAVMQVARRWRREPLGAATHRIAEELGEDAVWGLLSRFRGMLANGLTTDDALGDRAHAHRVAGIAGTLGFLELGELWRGVSDGTPPPLDLLRRRTRLTIGTIHRALG